MPEKIFVLLVMPTIRRGTLLEQLERPPLMVLCIVLLSTFLAVHVGKDLSAPGVAWYLRSTWVWVGVMVLFMGLSLSCDRS